MDMMKLSEAAAAMGAAVSAEADIASVCIDSRSIEPGCIFFAIKGENFDGHAFVRTALSSGAAAAVCSEPVEGASGPVLMVDDTRAALGRLAAYCRAKYKLPVVGLTGSVGKTTTKDMVTAVLSTTYRTLATEGNLNNDIGLPRMCFRLDRLTEAAVLEMGMSAFGEISYLTKIARPTIGLITNIGVSHIERLGSREGILKAKLEILDGMDANAPLVLNADDDMLYPASSRLRRDIRLYGIENPRSDCRASDIVQEGGRTTFKLTYEGQTHEVELSTIGRHNVYNACAAFLCGVCAGVTVDNALLGLRRYIPDGKRQKILCKGGITFIEDCYNASPDSVCASLSVMSSLPCMGKRIAVLGDMLELGDYARKAHRDCGKAVAETGVDVLLAYGTNAIYYIEGAGETVKSRLYDDKAQLAAELAEMLGEGDIVLYKASRGMKLEEVISQVYDRLGL